MRAFRLSALLLVALPIAVVAHETGLIRLNPKTVPSSGQLQIQGEKLRKSTQFRLELRSAMKSFVLVSVRTDTAGKFSAQVTLPADAAPGTYTVVALAPDNDVVARSELAVTPAARPVQHEGTSHGAETLHATDAKMELPVNTSSAEWAAIIGVTVLSLALGAWLWRGSQAWQAGRIGNPTHTPIE